MTPDYRREDDGRLERIEDGVSRLTDAFYTFVREQENRITKLETNNKWAGVIGGLVATFVSSVLLLFVTAWMRH